MSPSKNSEREAREARERLRRYNARQSVHDASVARRKRDNWFAIGAIVVVAALATVAQLFYFNGGPGTPTPEPTASSTPAPTETPAAGANVGNVPDPGLAENRVWTGAITLNNVALGIQLDGATAPQAVSSLIQDSQSGYFDGKTCHRLLSSESAGLLQCGSLTGDGSPDPAYAFGPIENAPADGLYPAGTIAMARVGDNAFSNDHQLFIVFSDATLPNDTAGGYTVVGQVTSGLEDLKTQITDAGVADDKGTPVTPTTITSFTIQ